MQKEIDSAVQFICGLLRARSLSLDILHTFKAILCQVMHDRYKDHWFPDKPFKGSAYRCMRINNCSIDPLILEAGAKAKLSPVELLQLLPNQLTIWVDPREVSYRIGEDGSIGTLYDGSSADAVPVECDSNSNSNTGSTSWRSKSVICSDVVVDKTSYLCGTRPTVIIGNCSKVTILSRNAATSSSLSGSSCRQEMNKEAEEGTSCLQQSMTLPPRVRV